MGATTDPSWGAERSSGSEGWDEATGWARLAGQPPRWFFHLVVAVPALVLLWEASLPGSDFFWGLAAVVALLGLGLIWLVRAVAFGVVAHRRPRSARWLAIAPVASVLVIALAATDVPLRVRWSTSRSEFAQVVAEAGPADTAESGALAGFPRRVGSYRVRFAGRQTGGAILFYETHGDFLDDAGFAHLPEGEAQGRAAFPGEVVRLHPLGGDWYTFSSSW